MTTPKKKSTPSATRQVAFRMKRALLKRLDAHARRLASKHPGILFTRTDAVLSLLHDGLDMAERLEEATR